MLKYFVLPELTRNFRVVAVVGRATYITLSRPEAGVTVVTVPLWLLMTTLDADTSAEPSMSFIVSLKMANCAAGWVVTVRPGVVVWMVPSPTRTSRLALSVPSWAARSVA